MMINHFQIFVLVGLVLVESRLQEIYRFMDELEAFWVKHPNQRFLQMFYNLLKSNYDTADLNTGKLYNLKDSEFLALIKNTNFSWRHK